MTKRSFGESSHRVRSMWIARSSHDAIRYSGAWLFLVVVLAMLNACTTSGPTQQIVIVGPRTTFAWPAYIAQQAGYYAKYGLDVKLVFASHPADIAMLMSDQAQVNLNTLQQAMELAASEKSVKILGSPLRKWLFALMARGDIRSVPEMKGKRVGISQIGGSTYRYAVSLLERQGIQRTDVHWISLGDNSRIAALVSGQVDATMLSAPTYFELQSSGFKSLSNISDYDDIYATNVLVIKGDTLRKRPEVAGALIKAHAEAVKRFYDDKTFSIKAHRIYDPQDPIELGKVYDIYAANRAFDRVPYIPAGAVRYMIENALDAALRKRMEATSYTEMIDNKILDELLANGFFDRLFESEVKFEELKQANSALR